MDLTYLMRVYICDTLDEIQMIWNVSSVENTNTGGRPKGRNPVLYCIEEEFHSHIYAYAKVYRFYGGSESLTRMHIRLENAFRNIYEYIY